MNTGSQNPVTPDARQREDRSRRRKALLAGGLVLGLGAAVTLAAWSDDVFASGTFKTGSFEMEGNSSTSAAAGDWKNYDGPAAGAGGTDVALLSFANATSPVADPATLQGGDTVWAPLAVRLKAGTTVDGSYVLQSVAFADGTASVLKGVPTVDGGTTPLRYSVYYGVPAATCTATPANQTPSGGTRWYQGTVGTVTPADARDLAKGASATAAGAEDTLCLGITLESNDQAFMGADPAQVIWDLRATAKAS